MTNKELIKKLQKLPGDMDVAIDVDENGYYRVEQVSVIEYEDYEIINIKSSNEI